MLSSIAAAMEAADPSTTAGFVELAKAVNNNQRLWTAFVVDLVSENNGLPAELRARLVQLGKFSLSHCEAVLRGKDDVTPLVEINRMVADGLRASAASASEAA